MIESVDAQSTLIADRLRHTRRYVKLMDLCTGFVTLVGGILGYLLLVSLIDHWVIDLSRAMRFVFLVILLAGVGAFIVWRMLPPLLYAVNPVYAAQTIEQAAPSLKNSLINLVLLTGRRSGVPGVIYEGLRREAAEQLEHVPPETMVDRGPLIKAGYWLVALLALAGLYKVFSPKDPVQSVARVVAPWKPLDRPARVRIADVKPGNADVYRGQTIDITARIAGLDPEEVATLTYSTRDGQFINQPIVMERVESQQVRAALSMGPRGIQQSVAYRITAGDAQSSEFTLHVKNSPHVEVRRIVYQFPRYTQLQDRIVDGQADISALEGTRVRIEAEANQPIGAAYLEVFVESSMIDRPDAKPSRAIPMQIDGSRATGHLTLLLQADRKTPETAAYQIGFTTPDGQRNQQPARSRIEVTPDLAPEIEWLQPRSADIELAENAAATLEIRAFDPDFAVQQIQLQGAVGGATKLKADLMDAPEAGQVVRKFQLVPRQLGLKAGDSMIYWAEARDNRHAATGTPAPNSARTPNFRVRVLPPDATNPADSGEAGEDGTTGASEVAGETGETSSREQSGEDGQSSQPAEGGQEGSRSEQGEQSEGAQPGSESAQSGSEGEAGEQKDPAQGTQGETPGADPSGTEQSDSPETNSATKGSKGGSGPRDPSGQGEAPGEQGDSTAETQSASQNPATGSKPQRDGVGGGADDEPPPEGDSEDNDPGRGESGNDSGKPTDRRGAPPADSESGPNENDAGAGESRTSTGEESPQDESQPVAPDGSNDSEAFERILRHLREQQGKRNDQPPPRGSNQPKSGDDVSESQSPEKGSDPSRSEPGTDGTSGQNPRTTTPQQPDGSRQTAADGSAGSSGDRAPKTARRPNGNAEPAAEVPRNPEQAASDDLSKEGTGSGESRSASPSPDESQRNGDSASPPHGATDSASRSPSSAPEDEAGESAQEPQERGAPAPRDIDSGQPGTGQPSPGPVTPDDAASPPGSPGATAAPGRNGQPSRETADGNPSMGPAADSQAPSSRNPGGGGEGGGAVGDPPADAADDAADQANVEYARRATDLALQHLKDQQQSADLRERLGWTQEEMEAFVRRWEQMERESQQAGSRGEQARRRWSDQLRGLGLQPKAEPVRSSRAPKDELRRLRQGGSEAPIPAEYLEQYRAFLRSAAPK